MVGGRWRLATNVNKRSFDGLNSNGSRRTGAFQALLRIGYIRREITLEALARSLTCSTRPHSTMHFGYGWQLLARATPIALFALFASFAPFAPFGV